SPGATIVSNRGGNLSGRPNQPPTRRPARTTSQPSLHRSSISVRKPHNPTPTIDDRDPVRATHPNDSNRYPASPTFFVQCGGPRNQRKRTNGRAYTIVAPKLFGSPSEVSTPTRRMMLMR